MWWYSKCVSVFMFLSLLLSLLKLFLTSNLFLCLKRPINSHPQIITGKNSIGNAMARKELSINSWPFMERGLGPPGSGLLWPHERACSSINEGLLSSVLRSAGSFLSLQFCFSTLSPHCCQHVTVLLCMGNQISDCAE